MELLKLKQGQTPGLTYCPVTRERWPGFNSAIQIVSMTVNHITRQTVSAQLSVFLAISRVSTFYRTYRPTAKQDADDWLGG